MIDLLLQSSGSLVHNKRSIIQQFHLTTTTKIQIHTMDHPHHKHSHSRTHNHSHNNSHNTPPPSFLKNLLRSLLTVGLLMGITMSIIMLIASRKLRAVALENLHVLIPAVCTFTVLFITYLCYCECGSNNTHSNIHDDNDNPNVIQTNPNELNVVSWNVSGVNRNPFEYRVHIAQNPSLQQEYENLLQYVEETVVHIPSSKEERDQIPKLANIFPYTEELFNEMIKMNIIGVEKAKQEWNEDFALRTMAEFLTDKTLGEKRLISMPDRVTNTIDMYSTFIYRPCVTNCYSEHDLRNKDQWWKLWKSFFFSKRGGAHVPAATLLLPISRAKYPAITRSEEEASIALQILCLALYDCIILHIVNSYSDGIPSPITQMNRSTSASSSSSSTSSPSNTKTKSAPPGDWQKTRSLLAKSLIEDKVPRVAEILTRYSPGADVMFLQEASMHISGTLEAVFAEEFLLMSSSSGRSQDSCILLRKNRCFDWYSAQDVTDLVVAKCKVKISKGDLIVCQVPDRHQEDLEYILCSFHGDSNGISTIPVLEAVHLLCVELGAILILGMDANSHHQDRNNGDKESDDVLYVNTLREKITQYKMSSCWGGEENWLPTTFHARTFIQPQLQKAAARDVVENMAGLQGVLELNKPSLQDTEMNYELVDIHPKDVICCYSRDFIPKKTLRDNTGKFKFESGICFPTTEFPSDHAVVSCVLERRNNNSSSSKGGGGGGNGDDKE
jgi:hypothetical protein